MRLGLAEHTIGNRPNFKRGLTFEFTRALLYPVVLAPLGNAGEHVTEPAWQAWTG